MLLALPVFIKQLNSLQKILARKMREYAVYSLTGAAEEAQHGSLKNRVRKRAPQKKRQRYEHNDLQIFLRYHFNDNCF